MSEPKKTYWTDDPEMVEKYVLGKLSPEEMERLDGEIADSEPSKAVIAQEVELTAGIRRHGRERMKAELQKKLRRDRASQFYSFQYIGMAAAVVVIAIGIGAYQIWFSDLVRPKQFQHPQVIITSKQDTAGKKQEQEKESPRDQKEFADRSAAEKKHDRREATSQEPIADNQKISERTTQSAVSEKREAIASRPSAADGAAVTAVEAASVNRSTAVWLIGNIVMVGTPAGSAMEKSAADRSARPSSSSENMIAAKKKTDSRVILRHRSMNELPADRAAVSRTSGQIETLLEKNDGAIVLTMYGDSVDASDVEHAVVESLTDDLLVVALPNQRITYHLPSGWNQSSHSR
ncbi:MAG: hypothetical protein ACOYNS_12715 [Bacteroidota bacterium]